MKKVIYKYTLNQTQQEVPPGRPVLVAQQHPNQQHPTLWVEHDLDRMRIKKKVMVIGTGHEFMAAGPGLEHIGSCVCGPFVWHVYWL